MAKTVSAKKVETLKHTDERRANILTAAQGACSRRLCIPDMIECGNRA
ncbi:MAG: hypothetical protein OXL36_18815 [Bryobacterales bacterium]|jgi:hypothetical protein|nr:hypothetical protein [Bryobacterales bacterium]MDE0296935.1 hypothetical protein [Bryobacterales bacterium]